MSEPTRLAELSANLEAVRRRVAAACQSAGRPVDSVTLIAISKTWPAADVLAMHSLGLRDFGESYDQEASAKAASLAAMGVSPRWHFVGRLQRNKCASIAGYADVAHAVDRAEVAKALGGAALRADRVVDVLLQVSLDADPGRGGVPVDQVSALAAAIAEVRGVRLAGVMAVAPRETEPAPAFAALARTAAQLRSEHADATVISAGMSGDLEAAIANGSTCVRVGTALFGRRAPVLD